MKNTKNKKKKKKKSSVELLMEMDLPDSHSPKFLIKEDGLTLVIRGARYTARDAEDFAIRILHAAARVQARQQVIVEVRRSIGSMT